YRRCRAPYNPNENEIGCRGREQRGERGAPLADGGRDAVRSDGGLDARPFFVDQRGDRGATAAAHATRVAGARDLTTGRGALADDRSDRAVADGSAVADDHSSLRSEDEPTSSENEVQSRAARLARRRDGAPTG